MATRSFYTILQYDGAGFEGWQCQPKARTVQGELEAGLEGLVNRRIPIYGSGRTDSGVHARGQVASFAAPSKWEPEVLHKALNAVTPPDLWVSDLGYAPEGFHARKHATARRYRFVLGCDHAAASPFRRPYEWDLGCMVDKELLHGAAQCFLGRHDFRAFSAVGQEKPHYRCEVQIAEWQQRSDEQGFIFTIQADRFLHRMVRFLVGTMVDVARGRRPLSDIAMLLEKTSNQDTSVPAPPHGLYMLGALYPHPELHQVNEFVLGQ